MTEQDQAAAYGVGPVVQPTPGAKPATTTLGWSHPRKGEQVETLCNLHLAEVQRALRTLAIGCIGTPAAPDELCVRCGKQLPWRYYLFPSPPLYVSQSCPTCGDNYTSDVPIRIVEHVGPDNHVFGYPEGPPTDG